MLELLALISTDPLDIVPKVKYPSGAKDEHNPVYLYGHKPSENPIVRIPYDVSDFSGRVAQAGIYEVILSDDKTFFVLVQSRKIVMKIPVYKYERIEKTEHVLSQKKLKNKNKKKKKNPNQKVIDEAKEQAKMKAYIKDTNKGYFVLFYKKLNETAYGFVPY